MYRRDGNMKALRFLATAVLGVALVPLGAGAASAEPPDNDDPGAPVLMKLGDRVEQDTSEATTSAADDALNVNCGAPATKASVWYTYSPGASRKVLINARAKGSSSMIRQLIVVLITRCRFLCHRYYPYPLFQSCGCPGNNAAAFSEGFAGLFLPRRFFSWDHNCSCIETVETHSSIQC